LFLVLKETSPEIWKKKLDWIAARGGMALINVHPDYVGFNRAGLGQREFPAACYREFLEYVRWQYPNDFWHALPREVAEYCSAFRPPMPNLAPRRVCMITHSFYQTDTRVMSYADALAERGDEVDVIGLKRDSHLPDTETMGRVRVYRVLKRFRKNEKKKSGYLLSILKFWLAASARLTREHRRRPYDLVHVHNVPDFLVFAAWYPKLAGAKVILDIHDMVPEFYGNKFHANSDSVVITLLKQIERLSGWFADHVIIANHLWHTRLVSRSVPEKKCTVFINHVNRKVFYPRERAAKNGKAVILFPGGLQWHQGLDIAIRAMPAVLEKVPEAEFHIYGDGNMKDELKELTRDLCLTDKVRFFDMLSVEEIAPIMSSADLGVVPKRADSFGNEAYSTKIMEFMSVGVPVVVSSTKIDRYYFNDAVVRFFESGNSAPPHH
jgi:glycosyltransferase involved in cell wall biosynthesis